MPTFDKLSVGIIAVKTKRTKILFLSEVLVGVASLDLKVPSDVSVSDVRQPEVRPFPFHVLTLPNFYYY